MRAIRSLLWLEAAIFAVAALVHSGILLEGFAHRRAAIAESAIAVVLLAGAAFASMQPSWTRAAGLAVQTFALLGTLLGLVMVAIGDGPRTVPDVVYHLGMVVVLLWGLVVAARAAPPPPAGRYGVRSRPLNR